MQWEPPAVFRLSPVELTDTKQTDLLNSSRQPLLLPLALWLTPSPFLLTSFFILLSCHPLPHCSCFVSFSPYSHSIFLRSSPPFSKSMFLSPNYGFPLPPQRLSHVFFSSVTLVIVNIKVYSGHVNPFVLNTVITVRKVLICRYLAIKNVMQIYAALNFYY